jgi:uncharacterized membrane protein
MTALARGAAIPARGFEQAIAVAGLGVTLLIAAAYGRHAAAGQPTAMSPWLALHLASIVPAMPLGAFVLFRPKGNRIHRLAGRIWAGLMLVAAVSSFRVVGLTGHLSPIHLLSALTLVGVPRAVVAARRGNIAAHRRGMTLVYGGSVIAGLFVFLPARIFGQWLFG